MIAHRAARTEFLVQNRLDPQVRVDDSWTCRRPIDGQVVQIDTIFYTRDLTLVMGKYDHSMPVGLDHPRAPCTLPSHCFKMQRFAKIFAPTQWKTWCCATSRRCFCMHAGGFVCWSDLTFGQAERSD